MDGNIDTEYATGKDDQHNIPVKYFELEEETELRIKMGESSDVKIKLINGIAEVYGAPMEPDREFSLLPNTSIAIYSWEGCTIKVSGNPETAYLEKETLIMIHLTIHAYLEERRQRAAILNKKGPVLLVVGKDSFSKKKLCRLLLNYAVTMNHWPLFLDLDVAMNSISVLGTVGALTVKRPADVVTVFDDHPTQTYQFGYTTPIRNITGYYLLLKKLNEVLEKGVIQESQNVKSSGMIINGCDWDNFEIKQYGFNGLDSIIMNFDIDIICVLYEEELYLQLKIALDSMLKIVFIPKIHTDVDICYRERRHAIRARMNKYLYGPPNQQQHFTFEVKYSDLQVYKHVQKSVPRQAHKLPNIKESDNEFVRVQLSQGLIDEFIAITSADTIEENPLYMPVLGFFGITDLDVEKDMITVISPNSGPIPKKILLMGEIKINIP